MNLTLDEKKIKEKTSAITEIDKIIHEPARMLIMSYLFVLESADFIFLRAQTGLTWGNLSSHMTKLEKAKYVSIEKKFIRKKPHTIASLTEEGKAAFKKYRKEMKQILE